MIGNRNFSSIKYVLQSITLSFSIASVCYHCYYLLAPLIWNQNISFQPIDLTPWIRRWTIEHDGIEIYVLYILMFLNTAGSLVMNRFLEPERISRRWIHLLAIVLCISFSFRYVATIGFVPPMNSLLNNLSSVKTESLIILVVIFAFIGLLCFFLWRWRSNRLASLAVALGLVPVCFIATAPISWGDYEYIFAPALRLLNGSAVRDIYFQYDLLLSLLAAFWMKLGLDLNAFQILSQISYYVTILGIFFLSKKIFYNKDLSIFLVITLTIVRLYASPFLDIITYIQVTPLRLDLWLLLLIVVYWRGPYDWLAGAVCGSLILLHKNFGIIYTLAYLQLLITLFFTDYIKENVSFRHALFEYGKQCIFSILLIIICGTISLLLFTNSEFGNYSEYYQKIGIGFIKISPTSFYWYVPPLFSMMAIYLLKLRKYVSSIYFSVGFLLIYCAIGNSIYFYGRSHENNILNISIILIFLLYFTLDLIFRFLNENTKDISIFSRLYQYGTSLLIIIVIIVFYSHNIIEKAHYQITNMSNLKFRYPTGIDLASLDIQIKSIRTITKRSNKVFFCNMSDFLFYYYGNYTPIGYINPFAAWIFQKDLTIFLQNLLDSGYYLACSKDMLYLLNALQYTAFYDLGGNYIVTKSPSE